MHHDAAAQLFEQREQIQAQRAGDTPVRKFQHHHAREMALLPYATASR